MKYKQGKYQIISKTAIARDMFSMEILCPEITEIAAPGQFVHILPAGKTLRRPISICDIDKVKGTLRIVFAVKGDGTEIIAQLNRGELIDMLAPLGRGFKTPEDVKNVVLIGGGIGTPPMLPLAKLYGSKAVAISGFRSTDMVILQSDFEAAGAETILCTDDGSAGIKGFVTDVLKNIMAERGNPDMICACGPTPMLKAVSEIANSNNIFCQVSLEERMGCGIGACLVCACKINRNDQEHFAHVCQDGPVFNSKEVIW